MNELRPSASQERWLLLAARQPRYRKTQAVMAGIAGWRTVNLLTRCAFFLLGLIAAVVTGAINGLMFGNHFAMGAGLALWATAEWLIIERRLTSSGIEEALIVSAFVLIAYGLLTIALLRDHDTAISIGFALALLLAGLRVLNPLFTTLAAIAISFAIGFIFHFALFRSSAVTEYAGLWASIGCYVIAIVALVFGGRQHLRPSYDRMLDWLVVVMPVMGYLWSSLNNSYIDYWHNHSILQLYVPVMPLAFAIAAFIVGLRRHTHAPLYAVMACIGCVAYELRDLTGMPLQWRLIMWGSLLLIVSTLTEHLLRTPRNGITSRKVIDHSNVMDVAEMAGTALISPITKEPAATQTSTMEGGDGKFGGGGASGSF